MKKNTYKTPSLPLTLGHSLSKCAKILKTNAIIEENDADLEERISAHALATLHNDKLNKQLLVPLAEDVVLLNNYLCTTAASLKESLKNGVDESKYSELAEVCLAHIILFNRKRSGEAARITIKQ